jgi:hypothetical protein
MDRMKSTPSTRLEASTFLVGALVATIEPGGERRATPNKLRGRAELRP